MTNAELDELARSYNTSDSHDQNVIFKKISKKYLPYINKRCIGIQKVDVDDIHQIYNMQILTALSRWEEKASFATYLFSYVRGTINTWLRTHKNKMYKSDRYHVLVDDMDTLGQSFYDDLYFNDSDTTNYTQRTQTL